MLEFGLVLANAGVVSGATTADELIELAQDADSSDQWDYAWVGDSLLSVPRFESVVMLSALAVSTSRLRLGVGCMASLGLRPPFEVAVQWASLDVLSSGRVTLVACPGPSKGPDVDRELSAFGITHVEKVVRMEDAMDLLRAASQPDGGPLSYQGADLVKPDFVQRPVPIWMVANPTKAASPEAVERALARVARLGDGWMTFGLPPVLLSERIELLKRLRGDRRLEANGYPICVYVDVNLADDETTAMADAVLTCQSEGRKNTTPDQLRASAAIGSTQQCVDFIAPLIEAGVTHVALRPVSQKPRLQVERITEELLPQLRLGHTNGTPVLSAGRNT